VRLTIVAHPSPEEVAVNVLSPDGRAILATLSCVPDQACQPLGGKDASLAVFMSTTRGSSERPRLAERSLMLAEESHELLFDFERIGEDGEGGEAVNVTISVASAAGEATTGQLAVLPSFRLASKTAAERDANGASSWLVPTAVVAAVLFLSAAAAFALVAARSRGAFLRGEYVVANDISETEV